MPERTPAWVSGINDFEARLATAAGYTSPSQPNDDAGPLRVQSGIRDSGGFPGQVTAGTNKVTVNAFQAVIQDPARPALGAYVVTLDAAKDLALTASDPALGRIDLVIAEVDSTVAPGFVVRIVPGTPAASPVPPTVTNPLLLKLAQITVPAASGTVSVTDLRRFTAALGGILPVRGAADLPDPGGAGSRFIYRLDTRQLQVPLGGQWTAYRPPRGSVDTWHAVTFLNGWTNYGSGWATAAYTITEDGWVHLKGLVKGGDITKALFQLPAGYRPVEIHMFAPKINGAGVGRLDVRTDGTVMNGFPTDGNISATWTSLSGISFPTY